MKRENEHKEYCEQDILDQISRMSEDTEVPDSLRSENIDKLLEKEKTEETFPSVSNRACSGGLRGSCGGNCSVAVWKDA